jgi:hypothetical protein
MFATRDADPPPSKFPGGEVGFGCRTTTPLLCLTRTREEKTSGRDECVIYRQQGLEIIARIRIFALNGFDYALAPFARLAPYRD